MKIRILILVLIFFMASLVITGTCATWPTEGWQTSNPEEQGMDSERLAEALDFLQEHREEYHLHSLLIIRHGYIVADVYFYPFAPGMMHDLASVTKSFSSPGSTFSDLWAYLISPGLPTHRGTTTVGVICT